MIPAVLFTPDEAAEKSEQRGGELQSACQRDCEMRRNIFVIDIHSPSFGRFLPF